MLSFKLFGNVELAQDGALLQDFRSQKELALLIYLAQTGQTHRRDLVAELLWESGSTKQALSNLRTVLARLHKRVGDALVVTHTSLAIAPAVRQQVDSVRLVQVLAGIEHVASNDQAIALQQALSTYRGDFLAHFQLRNAPRFDEWVMVTRESIRRHVIGAYHILGQHVQAAGDVEGGIVVTRHWLQVDPLDETAHMLLLRLLLAAGKIREATSHYDHCVELLRMELGVAPPAAMTALIKDVRTKRTSAPRAVAGRHNLPAAHDQFIGRETAQQELRSRLDQAWCRLITIAGPGGVGKTRLATTVARERGEQYADGVWLVELADLDPHDEDVAEAIAVEIASVLDLRFSGAAPPTHQLLAYLEHKHALLVLDNIEHLLHGSQIILDIVQRCEHVQLLVTSRQALHVRAEWVITLQGLSYPGSDADQTPAEAIELFVARRAQHQWQPAPATDFAAIRSICRAVEGLPLAIELAAALTRHATPQAIAARLAGGFDVLQTPLRDVPQRHQSLQVVFDMSWRTLTPALGQRLARLSVFQGGFTAAASQHIVEATPPQLAALCERSLVSHDPRADRYALHPVIRAYAAAKLAAADQLHHPHARYYLALLAQHAEPLQQHSPQDSMAVLEPEIDNLRLAWQTGLAHRRADWLFAALPSLSTYYQLRGLAREGEAVMHAAIDAATAWGEAGIALAARAGLERARFQNRLGQYWPAMQTIQAALKQAAASADHWAKGMAHVLWGESLWRQGQYEAARSNLAHALMIAHEIESTPLVGWCHHHLGIIDDIQGQYHAAHAHLRQACAAWRSVENTNTLSVSLNSLGLVCYHQGDLPNAQQFMEQALALFTQLDNRHAQALLLNNLSMVATERSDYQSAQNYLHHALDLAIINGNMSGQAEIHTNLGKNYHGLKRYEQAKHHLEQALQIAETLGNRSALAVATLYLADATRALRDAQRATVLYRQGLRIAQQDKLQIAECHALIGLADMLADTNIKEAKQHSMEAVALAEALGNAQLLEQARTIARNVCVFVERNEQNLSA